MGKRNPKLSACKESAFNTLAGFGPVSEGLKVAIGKELDYCVMPKHQFILQPPQICDTLYYINSGFAISYVLVDRKKITKAFWKPGQLVVSFHSLFNQTQTSEHILVVEKCEMVFLKYPVVNKLVEMFPEAQALYQNVLNHHYLKCMNRVDEIQVLTALKRFEKLLKMYPRLEQQVSQEAIAYYLGITPQSLSRIKRQNG